MKYDVIIIGGGPSGCFAADLLAGKGFKVLVLEEHEQIGEPVQCAGLISPRTMELAGVSTDIVINRLTGLRVYSPLGAMLQLNNGQVRALGVDRAAFDMALATRAQNAGAELLTGAKARGLERKAGGYLVQVQQKGWDITFETRLVIGADGVNSRVAKWLGLAEDMPRAVMYAADVELNRADTSLVDVFLGQRLAPGWFGWVIPMGSGTCRVGTGYAFQDRARSPRYFFQHIVDKFPELFQNMRMIRYTGGTVPLGLMRKTYAPHALLVGDAACQIKPISGGGIYLGLRGAQVCARVAAHALREDKLSEKALSRYQRLWEEEIEAEITSGIAHREIFCDFTDEDMDTLIRFLNKPHWQKMILKHGDIDHPSWVAKHLLGASPWMQRFIRVALDIAGQSKAMKKRI